jgi:CrcB protein
MQAYLWIALGGALGSMSRHWCNGLVARLAGVAFPYGTLVINIVGSFIIGVASATMTADGRWPSTTTAQQFVMVGICGGYTTFSSFSLQTLALMQGNQWAAAFANVMLSVALCLIAVWTGHAAGLAIAPSS